MKIKYPWSVLIAFFTAVAWGYLIATIVLEAVR